MSGIPIAPRVDAGEVSLTGVEEALSAAQLPRTLTRDSFRRRALAAADAAGIIAAYLGCWLFLRPSVGDDQFALLAATIPAWILLNKLLRLYDRDANLVHKSTLDELPQILISVALGTGLTVLAIPSLAVLGRGEALLFMALALVAVPSFRSLVRWRVAKRFPPERCLIVGSGFVGDLVARKIGSHPEYGVELVGFVDVDQPDAADAAPAGQFAPNGNGHHGQGNGNGHTRFERGQRTLLGDLGRFEEICTHFGVERVLVAFSSLSHEDLIEVIRTSKALGLKITVVPRLFEIIGHSVEVDQVEGMPLLGLRGFSRTRSSLALKRAIDVVGATAGLIVLSPLVIAIVIAIKVDTRGPALFAQRRIGRRNRPFHMLKFRTMVHGADALKEELLHMNEAQMPMFKIAEDPRITRVGRFLRRYSLDELPQLWNVLRGEMSLVGPRPLVPDEDDHVIGRHRERLDLTPGLTGPWQVMGRNGIPFEEMIKLDYLYVAEWSLWNDMKLLIRTAPIVLNARGH